MEDRYSRDQWAAERQYGLGRLGFQRTGKQAAWAEERQLEAGLPWCLCSLALTCSIVLVKFTYKI